MWCCIEESFARLSQEEREQAKKALECGDDDFQFRGLDAHEPEYYIMRTIMETLNGFDRFKGRYLNTHNNTREENARMLRVFAPLRKTLETGILNRDQLIRVMQARAHPENQRHLALAPAVIAAK